MQTLIKNPKLGQSDLVYWVYRSSLAHVTVLPVERYCPWAASSVSVRTETHRQTKPVPYTCFAQYIWHEDNNRVCIASYAKASDFFEASRSQQRRPANSVNSVRKHNGLSTDYVTAVYCHWRLCCMIKCKSFETFHRKRFANELRSACHTGRVLPDGRDEARHATRPTSLYCGRRWPLKSNTRLTVKARNVVVKSN